MDDNILGDQQHRTPVGQVSTAVENPLDDLPAHRATEVVGIRSEPPGTPGAVQFVSKSDLLRLVISPSTETRNHAGQIIDKTPERVVEFGVHSPRGTFWHSNPKLIEWLRTHPSYGTEFGGFTEVEPIAPLPTGDEWAEIAIASAQRNRDRLAELWQEENDGWAREDMLTAITAALEALEGEETASGATKAEKG